jgi:hypothetical protein
LLTGKLLLCSPAGQRGGRARALAIALVLPRGHFRKDFLGNPLLFKNGISLVSAATLLPKLNIPSL